MTKQPPRVSNLILTPGREYIRHTDHPGSEHTIITATVNDFASVSPVQMAPLQTSAVSKLTQGFNVNSLNTVTKRADTFKFKQWRGMPATILILTCVCVAVVLSWYGCWWWRRRKVIALEKQLSDAKK